MWRRWKAGESLHEIGRAMGKDHGSIRFLLKDWPPEQISKWLKVKLSQQREHARVPRDHLPQLIYSGSRSVEKKLMQHLRSKRLIRRSVHTRAGGKPHGQIVDAISIRERPAEIEERAIPGHREGDPLSGADNSHIATLVKRHSRFTILVKVPSKDTATVVDALTRQVRKLPASLRRSLT
jgi:IS30 family transposase